MTKKRSIRGALGWVTVCLGVIGMLGALAILAVPGLSTATPVAFGERLTVDVAAGDHAVYVTPSEEWGSITCTGEVAGDEFRLRPDMMQQSLFFPVAWDARGSFVAERAGPVILSCDGPAESAAFTVGPVVPFWHVAAAALLGIASLKVPLTGIVPVVVAAARRRRAHSK